MKQILLILFCMALFQYNYAQNLVPNPGFEEYYDCPDDAAQIYGPYNPGGSVTVEHWQNPTPKSPDYFNACADNTNVDVPYNLWGYHPAHNGNAYAALMPFSYSGTGGSRQEYIQVLLTKPLVAGLTYTISCYVKMYVEKAFTPSGGSGCYAVKELQASLTNTRATCPDAIIESDMPVSLKRQDGNFITDSLDWVRIAGTYRAAGGEKWLTIGVFNTHNPVAALVNPVKPIMPVVSHMSYYFIDDVYVGEHCDTAVNNNNMVVCKPITAPFTITSTNTVCERYMWNTGEQTRTINIKQPGKYWCQASNRCNLYIDTFNVTMYHDSINITIDTSFCNSADYVLSVPENGSYYTWSTGAVTSRINLHEPGVYTCSFIRDCWHYTYLYRVAAHVPTPFHSIEDTVLCKDKAGLIGNNYNGQVKYKWSTGETDCCIRPHVTGQYSLTVTDDCVTFTDTINLTVNDCTQCIWLPSAFTPNNDGRNDQLKTIPSCPINKFTLRIFNRWGQEVFTTQDIQKGWDGMHGAHLADVGTYYYLVEYSTAWSAEIKTIKGDVILLR